MCGRFVRKSSVPEIAEIFGFDPGAVSLNLKPDYNISPGKDILAFISSASSGQRMLRWGLLPPWSKDPKAGYNMINARAETLAVKPSYKKAFRERRCLIAADGFYEWRNSAEGKIPYYFNMRAGTPFGFAGIFESWQGSGGLVVDSCSIITTKSNALVEPIHDRMPAIVSPDKIRTWLDNSTYGTDALMDCLGPTDPSLMQCWRVGPAVNFLKNNSSECIEPV